MPNGTPSIPNPDLNAPSQAIADPIRSTLSDMANWSRDLPGWQRDALRRLYLQQKLSPSDLDELYMLCCQAHGLLEPGQVPSTLEPLQASHVPIDLATQGAVSLRSIGQAQNVNALASDQWLNLAESGLTIVYGDNGSGKSGYARVLKRACRARDQEDILPNAYGAASQGNATARINFSVGNLVQPEFTWTDGIEAPADLSQISVFDSRCASVHVDGKNELAYTPIPLQLFQFLAEASREIRSRLTAKKSAIESQIPNFRSRTLPNSQTAVASLVANLNSSIQPEDVRRLSQLSQAERLRLEQFRRDLAADPQHELRRLRAAKQRLTTLIAEIRTADQILQPEIVDQLKRLFLVAQEKTAASQFAATEAFKTEPLTSVGTEVWKALWEAARTYSTTEAYPRTAYPNTDPEAVCVLCQQPLSQAASARLKAFEVFVQEKVQQAADEARRATENFKNGIRTSVITKEAIRESCLLLRDELDREQLLKVVVRAFARSRVRASKLLRASDANELPRPITGMSVVPQLQELNADVDQRVTTLVKALNPEQRQADERELQGLEDRFWLATILAEVEQEIVRLQQIAAIDMALQDTDTNRITRKVTELSRLLVTATMRDAFASEVATLGMGDRRVELVQEQSGYGSTKFKVSLIRNPRTRVASIFSEGEHRCVALAAFLAELATAHNRSGLIFDDPVSSLDHNHRAAVAARLVREAISERQVIVFTHDIPFLMMLDEEARQSGLSPHYQSVSRADDRSGICADGAPAKAQHVPEILEKVERRLDATQSLHSSGRLDEWTDQVKWMTGRLRDTWELAVEGAVTPVFRRFSHKVHTGGLRKLTVLTEQDCTDLKNGFGFCSTYCHTDPAETNRPVPNPNTIREEINRLRRWSESVRARQEQMR